MVEVVRYELSFIDKPYVVKTYDCPGLDKLCRHFWNEEVFEVIEIDEYETEFRFETLFMQQSFETLVQKYLNDEYDQLLEEL